ncbi:MAG: iron ABC transporter permease [Candidatus Methanoplasma sp.]|jgi:iron complex transport system permease protein|nr:iron ABC transporter permease [Candidatus Methanoplasma sp.]
MFSKDIGDLTEREKVVRLFARRVIFIIAMLVVVASLAAFSMTLGAAKISAADAYKGLINALFPDAFDITDRTVRIMVNLRSPRVLMAAAAGASLAMGGAITQAILKNSLATPYTLGVSAGAGFGACLAILMGVSITAGTIGIITNAFIFSMIPVAVVIVASRFRTMSPMAMILCGVAISYIFGASNTLFQYFGDDASVKSVVFWTVGDLNNVSLWNLSYVGPVMTAVFIAGMLMAKRINVLGMGDDTAKSLGVNVERIRMTGLILSCLLTATVVCFTGTIGFICLLSPQISKVFVGSDMRYLLPSSALVGACLLLIADMGSRMLMSPVMLPVGAITALVGGPAFIMLLFSRRKNMTGIRV